MQTPPLLPLWAAPLVAPHSATRGTISSALSVRTMLPLAHWLPLLTAYLAGAGAAEGRIEPSDGTLMCSYHVRLALFISALEPDLHGVVTAMMQCHVRVSVKRC